MVRVKIERRLVEREPYKHARFHRHQYNEHLSVGPFVVDAFRQLFWQIPVVVVVVDRFGGKY